MKPKTVELTWSYQNSTQHVYTYTLDGWTQNFRIPKLWFDNPVKPPQTLVMEVRER